MRKTTVRYFLITLSFVLVISGLGLSGCGSALSPPASSTSFSPTFPGQITLATTNGGALTGTLIDVCEPSGCVGEQLPPEYTPADFVTLPNNGDVSLTFLSPSPDDVTLILRRDDSGIGMFDVEVDSAAFQMAGAAVLNWQIAPDPGLYVLEVYGLFKDGRQVFVWFPVEVN